MCLFVDDRSPRQPADRLRCDADDAETHEICGEPRPVGDVFRFDRGSRPTLLPVDRGQDRQVRRRDGHQIFLEPEGLDDDTSIPTASRPPCRRTSSGAAQTIRASRTLQILQPGYAIEYDHVDPRELTLTLETRGALPAFSSPGRSMAPPATKKPRPGHRRRLQCGAQAPAAASVILDRDRRLYRRDDRRSDQPGHHRALSHVHVARRVPPVPSLRQCGPALDAMGTARHRFPQRERRFATKRANSMTGETSPKFDDHPKRSAQART